MFLIDETYTVVGWRDGVAILRNTSTGQEIERPLVVDRNDGTLRVRQELQVADYGQRPPVLPVQDLGQRARLPDDP